VFIALLLRFFGGGMLLLAVVVAASTEGEKAPSIKTVTIATIKDKSHIGECGCWLNTIGGSSNSTVFYSENAGPGSKGWMNIDGADTQVLLDEVKRPKKRLKKGEGFTEFYSSDSIKVRVEYILTRPCESEDCESWGLDAKITVTRGKTRGTLSVTGECGCG